MCTFVLVALGSCFSGVPPCACFSFIIIFEADFLHRYLLLHTTCEHDACCRHSPVHTLTCCTHIFLVYIHCAHTSHILMRVTHMHGSRVSAVRMSSSLCHLAFSHLMCHPSLLLLFLDGHFETFPDLYDFIDFGRPRLPAELSRPKSAGQAHPARGRAVWLSGQVLPQHRL